MSKLIVMVGRKFGRFGILLFVIPVLSIFLLWLPLMDVSIIWFLLSGIVVIPLLGLATALLVGTLVAGIGAGKVKGITRDEAPGLWNIWETVVGSARAKRTVITIGSELNAGVRMQRILFGLLGNRTYLEVGIPLLAIADEEALAAIFAHEDAHVRNKDVNGSLKLVEFANAIEFVFEYAPPDETISGMIVHAALDWLSGPLAAENTRLKREAEFNADRYAAGVGQSGEMARALLLISAAGEFLQERVFERLENDLIGAIEPPRPPLERVLEIAPELSNQSVLNAYAARAWERPDDEDNDHPALTLRMAALGFSSRPEVRPIETAALSTLIDKDIVAQIVSASDRQWANHAADWLQR